MKIRLAAAFAFAPGSAAACATCFGQAQSGGVFDGIWWGIVLLLTVTMSLVGGIGWTLYKVEKGRLEREARG